MIKIPKRYAPEQLNRNIQSPGGTCAPCCPSTANTKGLRSVVQKHLDTPRDSKHHIQTRSTVPLFIGWALCTFQSAFPSVHLHKLWVFGKRRGLCLAHRMIMLTKTSIFPLMSYIWRVWGYVSEDSWPRNNTGIKGTNPHSWKSAC